MNKDFEKLKAKAQHLTDGVTITKRDFVNLCIDAMEIIDKHPKSREYVSYFMCGFGFEHTHLSQDLLLGEITGIFGDLELPDKQVGNISQKITKLKDLISLANELAESLE